MSYFYTVCLLVDNTLVLFTELTVEEEEQSTEAPPGSRSYSLLVRVTGLADSFRPPAAGSSDFEELAKKVADSLASELRRTKGYQSLMVNGFMQ